MPKKSKQSVQIGPLTETVSAVVNVRSGLLLIVDPSLVLEGEHVLMGEPDTPYGKACRTKDVQSLLLNAPTYRDAYGNEAAKFSTNPNEIMDRIHGVIIANFDGDGAYTVCIEKEKSTGRVLTLFIDLREAMEDEGA